MAAGRRTSTLTDILTALVLLNPNIVGVPGACRTAQPAIQALLFLDEGGCGEA